MTHRGPHRCIVIGGGITGLSCAAALAASDRAAPVHVTVLESSSDLGGLIRTSPFAGLPAVDEGADAWLVRVPWASQLAETVGIADHLTHPTGAHAAVWHGRLHPIPRDILLGVPAGAGALARGSLLSPLGKVRAAMEPVLGRRGDPHDSLGALVRSRFGRQVHERLVDPLIGSIYATDTDSFSLEAVPQIAELAAHRSVLLAAARTRRRGPASSSDAVFATPRRGTGELPAHAARFALARGAAIRNGCQVTSVSRADGAWRVVTADGEELGADSVVVAVPARVAAAVLAECSAAAARALALWEHASVVMVTMSIPANQWPSGLAGSGYLVPKPDQRWVTAASFGSNKWAHWRPADGSMVVRVSLGRDGLEMCDHDDESLVAMTLADMKRHLGRDFAPSAVRISRWPRSFPQYRPGHFGRLGALEARLAADTQGAVTLAGASYRGIGIPSCIQQGFAAADHVVSRAAVLGGP